jgi:hypothetical protein
MWAQFHPAADPILLVIAVVVATLLALTLGRTATRVRVDQPWLCLAIALAALFGSAAVSLLWRFPQPRVHDEFSYLLAADTFAHGRLTNQPHPRWIHFESIHILQQPSYASRYPPAQGMSLALSQLLGHPAVGLWLGAALGCGAVCWMLRAWLAPPWALFGSVLALLRLGLTGYWSQSFFGGWIAAAAGALLLGGLRRTVDKPRLGTSIVLAMGLVLLANSRPLEGLVLALPCAVVLLVLLFRRHPQQSLESLRLIVVPICFVLLLGAIWMAVYNHSVTGDARQLPHDLYAQTYMTVPYLLTGELRAPSRSTHNVMQKFHTRTEREWFDQLQTLTGWSSANGRNLVVYWKFYLGLTLSLPLLLLPAVRGDRWLLFALGVLLLYFAVASLIIASMPHYAAPLTGLVFYLVARGTQVAYESQRWRLGKIIPSVLLVGSLGSLVYSLVDPQDLWPPPDPSWHLQRADILRRLEETGEKHLIVVRYGPRHSVHEEWVYNEANIDDAPVVWAREKGESNNKRLLRSFRDRHVWLLEPDLPDLALQPHR